MLSAYLYAREFKFISQYFNYQKILLRKLDHLIRSAIPTTSVVFKLFSLSPPLIKNPVSVAHLFKKFINERAPRVIVRRKRIPGQNDLRKFPNIFNA